VIIWVACHADDLYIRLVPGAAAPDYARKVRHECHSSLGGGMTDGGLLK
jgi:hypothetical protein